MVELWHRVALWGSGVIALLACGYTVYKTYDFHTELQRVFYGVAGTGVALVITVVSSGLFMLQPRGTGLYRLSMTIFHVGEVLTAIAVAYTAYRIGVFANRYNLDRMFE